jgi:very-short-patch-repair endonuclease
MSKRLTTQEFAKQLKEKPTASELVFQKFLKEKYPNVKFKTQHVIEPYIIDFYFPTIKLALELDGCSHDDKEEYDNNRNKFLVDRGIAVLHARNHVALDRPEDIMETIGRHLQQMNKQAEEITTLYNDDFQQLAARACLARAKYYRAKELSERNRKTAKPFEEAIV